MWKVRMCLGMSFCFHLFLPPGLPAGSSSELFLSSKLVMPNLEPIVDSPNTGKRWRCSRASVGHKLAFTQTSGTEKLWHNRDVWPHCTGNGWFALFTWSVCVGQVTSPANSVSLHLMPIMWSPLLFHFPVYFLLFHLHGYHFTQHIFNSRHCATYITYLVSFNPCNNLVRQEFWPLYRFRKLSPREVEEIASGP